MLCSRTSKSSIHCKFQQDGVLKVEKYTIRGIRVTRDVDSRIEGLMNYAGIITWKDGTLWTRDSTLYILYQKSFIVFNQRITI